MTEEQAAIRGGAARRTGAGTRTVILSLIVLAVLIAVNLLAAALPARYTVFDLSANKMYSISETSEKAARKVKEDVTIYLVRNASAGENLQMETFVARYADMNSHITMKLVDTTTSPNFTSKYTTETLSDHSIIVESARRYRVIDYGEMAVYSGGVPVTVDEETREAFFQYYAQLYGEYPSVYFNGENLITSALDYVTTDNMTVIYTLSGHGEATLSDSLLKLLSYNNITSGGDFVSLTATAVPADCNILLINAPTSDLNPAEAKMIVDYLTAGGKVILSTAPGVSKKPNLLTVAAACGLDAADGVVMEQTAGNYYPYYPYYGLVPEAQEHEITAEISERHYMLMPMSHGILRAEDLPAGVTIAPIFSTTGKSYIYPLSAEIDLTNIKKPDDAAERSYWVGATATNAAGGKLIWLSSSYAITDTAQNITGANYTYVTNMVNWLCPRQTILETVSPISLDDPTLTVTFGAGMTMIVIFVAVIPLAFAITGLVIWIRRRRR